jgi:hypothetical protein
MNVTSLIYEIHRVVGRGLLLVAGKPQTVGHRAGIAVSQTMWGGGGIGPVPFSVVQQSECPQVISQLSAHIVPPCDCR